MRRSRRLVLRSAVAASVSFAAIGLAQPVDKPDPFLRDVLSVPRVGSVSIAPDGSSVAYTVSRPHWQSNRYDSELFIWNGKAHFALPPDPDGSTLSPSWAPGGQRLAFLRNRDGPQVFLASDRGTRVQQLTAISGGVSGYQWSPDGKYMALLLGDPPHGGQTSPDLGRFTVADAARTRQHLWLLHVEQILASGRPGSRSGEVEASATLRRLTGGDYTVGSWFGGGFQFTPDGSELLFDHSEHGGADAIGTQDISAVDLSTGVIRAIVRSPGIDNDPRPSPDGKHIVFQRAPGPAYFYRRQYHLATVPIEGGEPTLITENLPDEVSLLGWYPGGILFRRHSGVETRVQRMKPASLHVETLTRGPGRVHAASASADGEEIAYVGEDATTIREVYRWTQASHDERLTDFTKHLDSWEPHEVRLVRWATADGTEIEGILHLPPGYDHNGGPNPLIVLMHGGPAAVARPQRLHQGVYPVNYWLRRGAAVLEPNYRGSGGYGDAFMAMNVRRLGKAYAEDVLSGVDMLVAKGIADPDRLGLAGWSAGGDAAAYLATNSDRFAAISVGAGTSDLTLDYFTNDQPLKAREYLEATPWQDPEIYRALSVLTNVAQANTPTLIQHGRHDNRVNVVNALALYRGLKEVGAPAKLVIYEEAGHFPGRPKDRLAVNEHNRLWFNSYLWGDGEMPNFTFPGVPEE